MMSIDECLVYPYATQNISPEVHDVYDRDISMLIASFVSLGRRLQASSHREVTESDIERMIRICEDDMLPEDFEFLKDKWASDSKYSLILDSTLLQQQQLGWIDSLPNLRPLQQVIFPHCEHPNKWSIFLVSLSDRSIEGYTVGNFEFDGIKTKLFAVLERLFPALKFNFKKRLQIPSTFPEHPVLMASLLAVHLHCHGNYLDLNKKKIMQYKVAALREFQVFHDGWLGKFDMERIKITPYLFPFLCLSHAPEDDHIVDLTRFGWYCMDVTGDGNCGFYSIVLGLANIGNTKFMPSTPIPKNARGMRTNKPWQAKIYHLRKKLQAHSQLLLGKVFPYGEEPPDWFFYMGVVEDDDREGLSNFTSRQLKQSQYFDSDFANETEWHMNPHWGSYVLASLLQIRVVLVIRSASFYEKENKVSHDWSTTIYEYVQPIASESDADNTRHVSVTQYDHILRIPDDAVEEIPTIEIFFRTGFVGNGTTDIQHFQFLRRVLRDNIVPSNPNPDTLRVVVQRELENQHSDVNNEGDRQPVEGNRTVFGEISPLQNAPRKSIAPSIPHPDSLRVERELYNQQIDVTIEGERQPVDARQNDSISVGEMDNQQIDVNDEENRQPVEGNRGIFGGITPRRNVKRKQKQSDKKGNKEPATKRHRKAILDHNYFDDQFHQKTSKHKTAARMKWDRTNNRYFVSIVDPIINDFGKEEVVQPDDVDVFDPTLVQAANENPDNWVGCSLGDPGDGEVPVHLATNIPTIYQQHNRRFCLTYSLASALFYCGFKSAASVLAQQASIFSTMHFDQALSRLKELMLNLVPEIGRPTMYGKRSISQGKIVRNLTWETLFDELIPHPTVIIPVLPNGTMSHAFCVVDDLIFDSITPNALKLQRESLQWIFNDCDVEIYQAIRFNMKCSPPGTQVTERYTRCITLHWVQIREAPDHLATNVPTIYQQHNRRFCLTYSLASALSYCGFKSAASVLAQQASIFSTLDLDEVLARLKESMQNLVPEIGRPTVYGRRTKRHGRILRHITWETLFDELVPHPTVIISVMPDGTKSHAFCVVDDLIFDSRTPYALKLRRESLQWIFNDCNVEIYEALRFNMKYSPPGTKVMAQYRRPITLHWDHRPE